MVRLLVGNKGTGKTKMMLDLANAEIETTDGNIVFITKDSRLMHDLKYQIRVVSMEDYPHITNSDEYIGFIYGIISGDHDIATMYIDGILKHADFSIEDVPAYLRRLKAISKLHEVNFVVSLSLDKDELDLSEFEVVND